MKLKLFLLLSILALLFTSCGPGKVGYGVLLWKEADSSLENGQLLNIYIDSSIRDTYTFTPKDSKEMQEIVRWHVKFFEKMKDAETFAADYDQYRHLFGRTMQNGLPVRESPNAQSDRVYRLRFGEDVKILSRQSEQAEVGQYTGYWYKVLTKEGIVGYCFDLYLKVFDITQFKEEDDTVLSQNLIKFFETTYVPDYYRNMIANNSIDLDRFKSNYGLFPDLDNKTVSIVLDNFKQDFIFTDITSPSKDHYVFEGTSLKIQFFRSTYINATYINDNAEESRDFVVLNDVDAIIAEEKERRQNLLTSFLEPSKTLQSSAYGTLILDDTGGFVWNGFERLVPQIIPSSYGNKGSLSFSYFASDSLKSNYDGVISLAFIGAPPRVYVHFLYQRGENGIQLTTLQGVQPRGKVFENQSDDPVIIYFSYVEDQS